MTGGEDIATVKIDDLPKRPGELYGATVRAPIARGKLRSVRFDPSFDWSDVTAVQASDLQVNVVAGIAQDQPILADKHVRHAYEPVVLLACADRAKLARAKLAVHLDIDAQLPVLDVEASLANDENIWASPNGFGEPGTNVMKREVITQGAEDVAAELARCARVVRGSYSTHHQAPLSPVPRAAIAWWDDAGLHEHHADTPASAIIALHAELLARKSGRPVRMVYDRTEDLQTASKRQPGTCAITTGCDADGTLRVLEMRMLVDMGAYAGGSLFALSHCLLHAAGGYGWPTVRIEAVALATNTPPNGASPGLPLFAIERHLDAIARKLDVDPLALRRKNLLGVEHLDRAKAAAGYDARRKVIEEENVERAFCNNRKRLGMGGGISFHACEIAEVEVDLDTFEVEVRAFWIVGDSTADPATRKVQLEGAALQAIGWALYEEIVWKDGIIQNPRLKNYVVPTALDAPAFHTTLLEGEGGEPTSSGACAIAAAVEHATGIAAHHLPLTPERLFASLRDKGATC